MEFDFKTLRESRKAVAQKIAENLLLYGDLEAPNSGYGSHGTQDHIVAMGSANYLRYLAYIQSEPNGSQHFLTETEAAKEGLTIKRGTEPLILERWTVDAAKEYHAFDLPLYPVHHMEGEHKTLTAYMRRDLLRQHQPSRAALTSKRRATGHRDALPCCPCLCQAEVLRDLNESGVLCPSPHEAEWNPARLSA